MISLDIDIDVGDIVVNEFKGDVLVFLGRSDGWYVYLTDRGHIIRRGLSFIWDERIVKLSPHAEES